MNPIFADGNLSGTARDPGNQDAHLEQSVEYRYLQRTIERLFNAKINIGAIVQANAQRQRLGRSI